MKPTLTLITALQASSSSGPWLSSPQAPVNPLSLYLAQLRERLGESALKNIG